jgi:hypothetical protein
MYPEKEYYKPQKNANTLILENNQQLSNQQVTPSFPGHLKAHVRIR